MQDRRIRRKRSAQVARSHRKRVSILVKVGALAVSLVVIGYLAYAQWSPNEAQAAAPEGDAAAVITVTPPAKDIGDVFMDQTEVPLTFTVKNSSNEEAAIVYIETSCDCTVASVIAGEVQGPRFAMRHDTPPGIFDWQAVLAAGEEATLMVYYNPRAHGVFTPQQAPAIHGPTTRLVRLHIEQQGYSYVDVRIDLNQRH